MAPRKTSEENAAAKKAAPAKKEAPAKKAAPAKAEAPAAKKPATKKAAKKATQVIIQSPYGGEISYAEILAKVGEAEKVYVRVDQNKAYWVRGLETGDVDLW